MELTSILFHINIYFSSFARFACEKRALSWHITADICSTIWVILWDCIVIISWSKIRINLLRMVQLKADSYIGFSNSNRQKHWSSQKRCSQLERERESEKKRRQYVHTKWVDRWDSCVVETQLGHRITKPIIKSKVFFSFLKQKLQCTTTAVNWSPVYSMRVTFGAHIYRNKLRQLYFSHNRIFDVAAIQ